MVRQFIHRNRCIPNYKNFVSARLYIGANCVTISEKKGALHQFDYDHDNQTMASKDSLKNNYIEASPEKSFYFCLPWLLGKEFPT
jgi:hypothetical protein